MDFHPILYAIVPYSIQSKLVTKIDSTLDNFLKYNKLDKDSYAMVQQLFKNQFNISANYTKYIFQYYKLLEDKTISKSIFLKSYETLQSIFKDVYIDKKVILTLPSILTLTEIEYNSLKDYLEKRSEDHIVMSNYLSFPFINTYVKEQLFYELICYSYFSCQTLPNDTHLYIYGLKLSPIKQKLVLDIFVLSKEQKKELEQYFSVINSLYESIQKQRIKDIETQWDDPEDSIFKVLKDNFYKPMSQSFQLKSMMESYYKTKYTIHYDSPILYTIFSKHDLTKASPDIFYKFLEIVNSICLEENPEIRKKLVSTILYNDYSDGLLIQPFLKYMEDSAKIDRTIIHNANALGFIRLEWIDGAYRHTPLPISHTHTVEQYLKTSYLFKDPVKSLYPITHTSSNPNLFLPISYTPTIQIIYSIIFNTIIIPSIVNDINKNN